MAKENWTIPVDATTPGRQPGRDPLALDADTRDYLQLLIDGAGRGLKGRGGDLREVFRRFEPTHRDLAARQRRGRRAAHEPAPADHLAATSSTASSPATTTTSPSSSTVLGRGAARVRLRGAEHLRRRARAARARCSRRPTTLGKVAAASPTCSARPPSACARPPARSTRPTRPSTPFAKEATPLLRERHPPVRARGAPARRATCGPPSTQLADADARPDAHVQRSSTTSSTCSPTTRTAARARRTPRARRATCSGSPGRSTWRSSCSRPRTPTARSARSRSAAPCATIEQHDQGPARARVPRRCSRRSSPTPRPARPKLDEQGRPLTRPHPHDGRLRAVVLRAAAVPVAVLRRPGPAQAEGLPRQVAFPEATSSPRRPTCASPACRSARCARSRSATAPTARVATIELERRYAPLRTRRARRSCARRRCSARPTSSSRPGTLGADDPRGRAAAGRRRSSRRVELDEIFDSLDPQTRAAFQGWQQELAKGIEGRGRDFNDALGTLPGFAADGADVLAVLDTPGGRGARGSSRTPAWCSAALTAERGAAAQPDHRLQAHVRRDRVARTTRWPRRSGSSRPSSTSPSSTLARVQTFSTRHRPADHGPAAGRARPAADAARRARAGAGPRALLPNLDPLITASKTGLPATREVLEGAEPLLGELRPFLEQLNPIFKYLEASQWQVADFLNYGAAALSAKTDARPAAASATTCASSARSAPRASAIWKERAPDQPRQLLLPAAQHRRVEARRRPGLQQVQDHGPVRLRELGREARADGRLARLRGAEPEPVRPGLQVLVQRQAAPGRLPARRGRRLLVRRRGERRQQVAVAARRRRRRGARRPARSPSSTASASARRPLNAQLAGAAVGAERAAPTRDTGPLTRASGSRSASACSVISTRPPRERELVAALGQVAAGVDDELDRALEPVGRDEHARARAGRSRRR